MLQGEEDEENDGEQDDDADEGFFVPHGYLSEGEGCDDDGDEGKVSSGFHCYLLNVHSFALVSMSLFWKWLKAFF